MIRKLLTMLMLVATLGAAGDILPGLTEHAAHAQGRLIYRGSSEYGFNRSSHAPTLQQEAVVMAMEQIRGSIDGMTNISQFTQFSKHNVTQDIDTSGSYAKVVASGRVKYSKTSNSEADNNWIRNGNNWLVVVSNVRIKPGTWYSRTETNWKGERSSKAGAVMLYDFAVYGPDMASTIEKVEYTIRNDSGRVVRFSMQPSGRSYALDPSNTFRGVSNKVNGKSPTVTLTDTGRTYRLDAGNHKFWWMKSEGRIGFDRNID
jgi:hypothetical protein